MRLDGKVALVTGVSSGFGRGTAEVFAREGARVVGIARTEAAGRELEEEVRRAGGELTFVPGDVTKPQDCERAVAEALRAYGRLDILVNNAGAASARPVAPSHEVTEEHWDEVVDTNLKGTFFCCRYALEPMRTQRDGTIINISSINAVQAVARMAAYNSSKAAVLQLTKTLAVEYLQDNVRVNAIVLGGAPTPMSTHVGDEMARAVRGPDFVRPARPAQMSHEEFGMFLTLLCGDEARVVTGAVIAVDRSISAGLLTSTMIYLRQAGLLPDEPLFPPP